MALDAVQQRLHKSPVSAPKPIQAINRYKADLREFQFLLFEQFKLGELLGKAPFEAWGEDEVTTLARRVLPLRARGARPAQRRRRQRGLPARGRPRHHADRLQGRVEEALRGRLEDRSAVAAGARRRRRAARAAGPRRGDALRREHRVQHVPGPRLRRGRGHRRSSARPEQKKLYCREHVQRHVGRHDVPHRAAGRQRRRLARRRPRRSNADGTLHDPRHEDLHLRRRPRPRREHHPPGARARRRRARRHEGPHALHRAEASASTPTARSASRTTSPSARIEHKMGINGSATCVLNFGENGKCIGGPVGGEAKLNQGMPQMFKLMNGARIAVGVQGVARRVERVPQRARVREGAQAGREHHALEGRRPRRACRSSSTPTCAACCST